jgi:hypothetical protein
MNDTVTRVWDVFKDRPVVWAICIYCSIKIIVFYGFKTWNRLIRHLNIKACGWPPPHLDADGDFKPEPKPEEED